MREFPFLPEKRPARWIGVRPPSREAWLEVQDELFEARREGRIEDLLVQIFGPEYTEPTWGPRPGSRSRRGGRGKLFQGGPAWIEASLILDLEEQDRHLLGVAEALSRALARALELEHLPATTLPSLPGVWIDGHPIAEVGLSLSGGIAGDGYALRFAPETEPETETEAEVDPVTQKPRRGVRDWIRLRPLEPANLARGIASKIAPRLGWKLSSGDLPEDRAWLREWGGSDRLHSWLESPRPP